MSDAFTPSALGLSGAPEKIRVVVAMSGGVDSSVAAALLKEAGYDVVGITLQLYDHGAALQKKNACCAGQDIYDAAQVAEKMGFPHYVLNYESAFRTSVIDDFAESYLRGETPIPCVRCNQRVKFDDLLKTARELGAEALVTGHYAQRKQGVHHVELHKAIDPRKDQSYFLFATTQDQLDYVRFPLGGWSKETTRAHAERLGLPIAEKPDSQDICFVPEGRYSELVQKLRPGAIEPGAIVDQEGRVLGTHQGIIHFTVGQRRGLNLGGEETGGVPHYVIAVRPETREVVVGPREALAKTALTLKEVNWLGDAPLSTTPLDCMVRIRSMHEGTEARVWQDAAGIVHVELLAPEFGVSAGQACVLYNDSRVLGGGWITR